MEKTIKTSKWFFPDDEYRDSVFGSADATCLSRATIEWLADGWEMSFDELMGQMHEASSDEIAEYGTE